jgi:exonuclease III
MIRILFQNPQGLGRLQNNEGPPTSKINKLKNTLLKHDIDLIGFAEVNKDWRLVPQNETWWSTTDGWFEHRRMTAGINRKVPPTSRVQYGGTLLMAMNKIAFSIAESKEDPRSLGRWTSLLLRGKNQQLCRIICAYCPCRSLGPSSSYALQLVGLTKERILECPRKMFWTDLRTYVTQCQEQQETVILMGDWNSNYNEVVTWMQTLGLTDAVQIRHPTSKPPITCKRSTVGPIDAIFVPQHFKCWRGGYLAFDYLEGDHRGIWCDIPTEYILGYCMHHPTHSQARRLKTDDPRITRRYNNHLDKLLKENNIYNKMEHLHSSCKLGFLPTDAIVFEDLDTLITNAMMITERKCRKLKTGTIPWSPLYQQACDRVTYWTLVQKDQDGKKLIQGNCYHYGKNSSSPTEIHSRRNIRTP